MYTKTETNGWGSGSSCFGEAENCSLIEIRGHLVVPDDEGSAKLDLDTRRGFGDGDVKWGGHEDATGGWGKNNDPCGMGATPKYIRRRRIQPAGI